MSVTMVGPCHKRSVGFTIDSIIGKRSEKSDQQDDKVEYKNSDPDIHEKLNGYRSRDDEVRSPVISAEGKGDYYNSQRTKDDPSRQSPVDRDQEYRDHTLRLHQQLMDPIKHLHGHTPESLKHLHDVLAQTSGATGTYIPAPRVCRHPLSTLNIHSMYPPSHLHQPSPLHSLVLNPASRDIRSVNPWMSDRYPGYYYPRYPVAAAPGFLFQPYRKPKRIRTAFSPSQLLQLEKSFEKSHYVVGQERKDLASELQLTETQVKVWFQNRRTKHKRMKSEDGSLMSDEHDDDLTGRHHSGFHCSSPDIESDVSDEMDASDDEITVDHNT